MTKFAVIVSLVAVGLAGYGFLQQLEASPEGGGSDEIAQLRQEIADLKSELARVKADRGPEMLAAGNAPAPKPTPGTASLEVSGKARESAPDGARPKTVEERLAALETMADKLEKGSSFIRTASGDDGPVIMGRGFRPRKHIGSLASAKNALDLDDGQVADMERIFEDAKDELERLKDTPNEDGETLRELEKNMRFDLTPGEQPDMAKIMKAVSDVATFKQGKVPGTNETYREAEQRIHKRAMADARETLNDEQQKEWDGSMKHGLVPGATGAVMTTSVSVGDGGAFIGGFGESVEADDDK